MLSDDHLNYLTSHAISADLAEAVCETTPEGIAFNFTGPTGRTAQQVRLDNPRDPDAKYIGPAGVASVMPVPPGHEDAVHDTSKVLVVVEGSKGILAAASALEGERHNYALVGVLGCYGWSHDGGPGEDLRGIPVRGRDIVVIFDADMASNRNVWDACEALRGILSFRGASTVSFANIPMGGKAGMDDALVQADNRFEGLQWLIDSASDRLPRRPAAGPANRHFDNRGSLLADQCASYIFDKYDLAVTEEQTIAVFANGVYNNGTGLEWEALVSRELGDMSRKSHYETLTFEMLHRLVRSGRRIGERPAEALINVSNGLVDPAKMELREHSPEHYSMLRLNVEYDPEATCPTWLWWLDEMVPGQREAIEDVLCTMLDPKSTPSRAMFCYGPSHTGKSTISRIMREMVGKQNTSSVSFQQLNSDKFAVSNLYGKILNIGSDIPSKGVDELSVFKQLTGEDRIFADRKWGAKFEFTNQALMIFTANNVPSVEEKSKAWEHRVAPFKFEKSFGSNEDPSFEQKMIKEELPGIFLRLVKALNRRMNRGPGDNIPLDFLPEFLEKSTPLIQFLNERTVPTVDGYGNPGTERTKVWSAWEIWCQNNGYSPGGRNDFYGMVRDRGVIQYKKGGVEAFRLRLVDPEKSPDPVDEGEKGRKTPKKGEKVDSSLYAITPHSVENASGKDVKKVALLPFSVLPLDLETASADQLHSYGPGYIRLVQTPGRIDTDTDWLLSQTDRVVTAHNGFNFDFPALAVHSGMDMLGMSERGLLYDTKVGGILASPPMSGEKPPPRKRYSLNSMSKKVRGRGKADDLKRLAEKYGGFDRIPSGDDEYRYYAAADITAMESLLPHMRVDDYAAREMKLMGRLAYPMRVIGWRVDTALVASKVTDFNRRQERGVELLQSYGFPEDAKAPQRTNEGQKALESALTSLGVYDLPRTATGKIATSRGDWSGVQLPAEAQELMEIVWSLNGDRTIYGTVDNARVGDRVYPEIMPYQATGRFSIDPGLTVVGKRGGRHHERAMYLPDRGEVLCAWDLNQIDARAIAMHCQDPDYMNLFIDPEIDSHRWVAKKLWGKDDDEHRNRAKAIAHGWNYGQSLASIADHAGLDISEVKIFDAGMRENFPGLISWQESIREEARAGDSGNELNYLDNGMGRKLRVRRERAHTQAPAFMGQSLARDLLCEGILRLPVELVPMIRAVVHDELVMSVPVADVEDVKVAVLEALQFEYLGVPVTAGWEGQGDTWAAIYEKGN